MKVIAEQIGKEKGYTLVLEVSQGAVVYAGPGSTDITAELIKRYDAAYPG
jgi:Skp family chaperone for outer membrane proteins